MPEVTKNPVGSRYYPLKFFSELKKKIRVVLTIKSIFCLILLSSLTLGHSQTNTISAENYWTSVKEFPMMHHSFIYHKRNNPPEHVKHLDAHIPIFLNVFDRIHPALNITDTLLISRVKALSIYLNDTDFTIVKKYCDKFKNLQFIHVSSYSNHTIKYLPIEYFQSLDLRGLAINCNINSLPKKTNSLNQLEYLQIGSDSLKEIKANLSEFKKLRSLYLTGDLNVKWLIRARYINLTNYNYLEIKQNFSNAKVSSLTTLQIKELPKSIRCLVLKLKQGELLSLNNSQYFDFLYVSPGLQASESKVMAHQLLCDATSKYEHLITEELILDSLRWMSNLNKCVVFKANTNGNYMPYSIRDSLNSQCLLSNKIYIVNSVNFLYYNSCKDDLKQFIDFSSVSYFEISEPKDMFKQINELSSIDSFGCLTQLSDGKMFEISKARLYKNKHTSLAIINEYYLEINRVFIDTLDEFSIACLRSVGPLKQIIYENCTKEGLKYLRNYIGLSGLIWLNLSGRYNDTGLSSILSDISAESVYLNFEHYPEKINFNLNSNTNMYFSPNWVSDLSLCVSKNQIMYTIGIKGERLELSDLSIVRNVNVKYENSLFIKFDGVVFLGKLDIHCLSNKNSNKVRYEYSSTSKLLINELEITNPSKYFSRTYNNFQINKVVVDSINCQVDFSGFLHVRTLHLSNISKAINTKKVVLSINKMTDLEALWLDSSFYSNDFTFLRDDIQLHMSYSDYVKYRDHLVGRQVWVYCNPGEVNEKVYNPNFYVVKNE